MPPTSADFRPSHLLRSPLGPDALVFAFHGDKMLLRSGGEGRASLPVLGEVDACGLDGDRHMLGELGGLPCIAINLATAPADALAPDGYRYAGLRSLFPTWPEALLAIAGRAFQVVEWDRTHRYCGRCGTPTTIKSDERAKSCPGCGYVVYPRVSPAMMVLVTRGRELLLARASRFTTGMYSALAGFVESGESIEDCIRREVREEVGVEVTNLVYFASQSWAFPHSLMIAYSAEYAGGQMRPCDPEIADAQWFALDALPQLPSPISIARKLIDATIARLSASD
jgi:NAD+ diphosphatase